jgi:hypothetical protein
VSTHEFLNAHKATSNTDHEDSVDDLSRDYSGAEEVITRVDAIDWNIHFVVRHIVFEKLIHYIIIYTLVFDSIFKGVIGSIAFSQGGPIFPTPGVSLQWLRISRKVSLRLLSQHLGELVKVLKLALNTKGSSLSLFLSKPTSIIHVRRVKD